MDKEIDEITSKIIGCAYNVLNGLGVGFLEKVYENALIIEMKAKGINVEKQKAIKVFYRNEIVGEYIADLMVENKVIIELKAIKNIDEIHIAQCLNYLKATNTKVGLILNFGQLKLGIKRLVL